MENKQTVWISKYALTKCVYPVKAEILSETMISIGRGMLGQRFLHNGWHRTREAALKEAEKMRVKRLASLRKQITKLEALKFEAE